MITLIAMILIIITVNNDQFLKPKRSQKLGIYLPDIFQWKEKLLFKTKLSLPAFHFAACLYKQCNPKKESSALNLINMTLASIDTRLLSRNCEINCLRLGRSGQYLRPTFGANYKRKLNHRNVKVYVIYHFNNKRAPYLITKLAFLLCQYKLRCRPF